MRDEQATSRTQEAAPGGDSVTDAELERIRRQRFGRRVERVLAVMREERIDWKGVPFIAPDGRVGVRVVPVEMAGT